MRVSQTLGQYLFDVDFSKRNCLAQPFVIL